MHDDVEEGNHMAIARQDTVTKTRLYKITQTFWIPLPMTFSMAITVIVNTSLTFFGSSFIRSGYFGFFLLCNDGGLNKFVNEECFIRYSQRK